MVQTSQWITMPIGNDDVVVVETNAKGEPISTWVKGRKKATKTKLVLTGKS